MEESDCRLLVVDDDMDVGAFVRQVLQAELRCHVEVVDKGKDVLKYCANYHPDLVLLDFLMPELDGSEIALRLKALQVPFVAMTSLVASEHIHRLIAMGSFSFLAKPVSKVQLLGTVISALSHIKHIQAIQSYADSASDIGTARGAISAYLSIHPDQAFDVLNEMARDTQGNVKDTALVVNQFLDFLARANRKHKARLERVKKRRQ